MGLEVLEWWGSRAGGEGLLGGGCDTEKGPRGFTGQVECGQCNGWTQAELQQRGEWPQQWPRRGVRVAAGVEGSELDRQQCKLNVRLPLPTLRSPVRHKSPELSFCHLARGPMSKWIRDQLRQWAPSSGVQDMSKVSCRVPGTEWLLNKNEFILLSILSHPVHCLPIHTLCFPKGCIWRCDEERRSACIKAITPKPKEQVRKPVKTCLLLCFSLSLPSICHLWIALSVCHLNHPAIVNVTVLLRASKLACLRLYKMWGFIKLMPHIPFDS